MKKDEYYMDLAIVLANKGGGNVNPNPQVGALIVKEGRIIGQGYHEKYGKAHAEINAFKDCNESPEGATLYVTLEPCAHQGKQPPCFEAIRVEFYSNKRYVPFRSLHKSIQSC